MNIPVIIIGGGPAGAATALQLRSRGYECLILEASATPVRKPGETIPPQSWHLFKKSGLETLLHHPSHLTCYGNRFIWGDEHPVDKSFFANTVARGWHLCRDIFEEQLSAEVTRRGAQYLPGCTVTAANFNNGQWHVTYIATNKAIQTITCKFIVDATGRKARVARKLGIQRNSLDRLAGITTCITLPGSIQQFTYLEAVQTGWWYAAPLTEKQLVLSFMTDTDLLPATLRSSKDLLQSAATTTMISELITGNAATDTPLTIASAATGYLQQRSGHQWLAVGDAAYSYDPISSYGITSALESGYYAGHAIADHLNGDNDALRAYDWAISTAFSTYLKMLTGQYLQERRWQDAPFWSRRN
ncbi:NAD(P)/FAD-dependent oxidoreductase [Chitinophaga sp. Cy-1792]|uniref:NAD(P)/FAD-dependent oxidoreductase n=1 Tax=Chitinophaga sp. Cy-1792 TaxID=2608339 RepID=UPI001422C529|nr:NAD(P)/FAD-dependent oxidoreductase [Chitinophaga sp. Cy-1792]